MRKCDILIIGSGIAGASVALALAKKGLDVILLSTGGISNSSLAQGGIVYQGGGDSPDLLMRDIFLAGAGLSNPAAVSQIAHLGPDLVRKILIDELLVPFDTQLTQEAAHSMARILYRKDQTGLAIIDALMQKILNTKNIEFFSHHLAIDLITPSHHSKIASDIYLPPCCVGAYVLDMEKNQVDILFAKETILATGGLGEVYLHTTNPVEARGDGIAMAFRAGARIMNMEYIQFHPTALYVAGEKRFLLSEALRGEGGKLLNTKMEPFMHKYHEKGDLAPRDVVSRAIFQEMVETSADHVWLDISFKPKAWLMERFPAIYHHCKEKGFDLSAKAVPVVPAAHYSCGGVAVDLKGQTSLSRLRAVGEVSCTGLHGANRLASTSLLEGLVWAHTTADDLIQNWDQRNDYFPPVDPWQMSREKIDMALIRQDWNTIKQTMWNYVGLIRDRDRLRRALKMLRELQWEIDSFYEKGEPTASLIGLRNGVLSALLIAQGAWKNKHSLGCHYRIS